MLECLYFFKHCLKRKNDEPAKLDIEKIRLELEKNQLLNIHSLSGTSDEDLITSELFYSDSDGKPISRFKKLKEIDEKLEIIKAKISNNFHNQTNIQNKK